MKLQRASYSFEGGWSVAFSLDPARGWRVFVFQDDSDPNEWREFQPDHANGPPSHSRAWEFLAETASVLV